jgi:hypothetical protein
MKTAIRKSVRKKRTPKKTIGSYETIKDYKGKQYVGMQIGRSHKWYYDKGEWKDKKITPDLWEIRYAVTKRRAGKAPRGSGAPVGTGYHWYILAHQEVLKLNEDDYTTVLSGLKYKIAHKRAAKGNWSASVPTQRKTLLKFLKEMVAELEKEPVPIKFTYKDVEYKGEGVPVPGACLNGVCYDLDINLNGRHVGMLHRLKNSWKIEGVDDEKFVEAIGDVVTLWYE